MKWILIMALNLVSQFHIHPSLNFGFSSPFLDNRTVKTYWNDGTNAFEVIIYDTGGNLLASPTSGPTVLLNPYSRQLQCYTKFFSYCVGNDLHVFHPKTGQAFGEGFNSQTGEYVGGGSFVSGFPYAQRRIDLNHWSCNIHVCDIEFDLPHTAVTEDSGLSDGTIEVKANSGGGDVRFTRDPNSNYDDAIPSVAGIYTFTGLASGTYIIYALDPFNCKTSLTVNVPGLAAVYDTRWRLQYHDSRGRMTRVDIEQRGFGFLNGDFNSGLNNWVQSQGEGEEGYGSWTVGSYLGDNSASLDFAIVHGNGSGSYERDSFLLDHPYIVPIRASSFRYSIRFGAKVEPNGTFTNASLYAFYNGDHLNNVQLIFSSNSPDTTFTGTFTPSQSNYNSIGFFIRCEVDDTTGFNGSWMFHMLYFKPNAPDGTDIIYVKGSSKNPYSLPWSALGEVNIFAPVSGLVSDIDLISETDFMFQDLFTQDERMFKVKTYKDTGSGLELKFTGYVLPMVYSEPYYTDRNYPVHITANDQIGNLKDIDFTDDSGNALVGNISFLDAICTILRKTDIPLDVRESVNIFETTMDQDPEDSALQQAFFDASLYLGKNCEEVLVSIMTNWGARVYQAEGYWNIDLVEQRASTSIVHRIFTINGQYQSNGFHAPVTNIKKATASNRSVLRDRSGLITINPSYGKLKFNVKTSFVNNLLTRGTFERVDIQNNQIIGWTFDMTNGTGVSYGIEDLETARGDSKGALFIDFGNVTTEKEIIIRAESFNLDAINGPSLSFKFDVLFRPHYKEIFSYIDVSIKIGDNWVVQSFTGISDNTDLLLDGEYNRYYVDSALEWKTIEQKIYSSRRQFNTELEGPVLIKIRVNNNAVIDYASITALRAQITDNGAVQANLTKVKVQDGSLLRLYTLNSGTDADNSPDVIRPNDYNGTSNPFVWKLDKTLKSPVEEYLLAGLLIDNVILSLETSYPENVILEKVIDTNIKPTFELDLVHCDLLISELSSAAADENTLRLSKSFIRKNDGTQTVFWKRTYEVEARPLLDILLKMYQAQVTLPSFKLSGSFYSDIYPSLFNSFFEDRMGKYFLPISLNIRDAECSFDSELIELRTGQDGEPPTPDTYEFTDEHTTEFDA